MTISQTGNGTWRVIVRGRQTLETAFQEMEATLNGEIAALGYPRAALFTLCVALVAYNVTSPLKGALRSVHGTKRPTRVSRVRTWPRRRPGRRAGC